MSLKAAAHMSVATWSFRMAVKLLFQNEWGFALRSCAHPAKFRTIFEASRSWAGKKPVDM
jgi:hypothetical protein